MNDKGDTMSKLTNEEKMLLEGIKTMLQHDAQLGLKMHSDQSEQLGQEERGYEYLHNQIDEMFALKAAELTHANGVCQAFSKVHNYKYLDDPAFATAMEKEMVAQAVPASERAKALSFVPSIIKELREDKKEWAEKDFGFNPKMDEVIESSSPEQPLDFNIEEVDDWTMKSNVDFEEGDASPGHIE
jgi:hypothetical protein